MNPIREMNAGTALLRMKFAGKPLTSVVGISNILVWMGTRQGYGTKHFIDKGEMWFSDLNVCVDQFAVAHRSNLTLAHQIVGDG